MEVLKIGEAEVSVSYLQHHFERLFWKQSETLTTDEQCKDEARRVVQTLCFIAEESEHYTDVSKNFESQERAGNEA